MNHFRIQAGAVHRLDEIYRYTADKWGDEQAELYVRGLFDRFAAIAGRRFPWRPVPAEFGVDGDVCRYEHHLIYWKLLADGDIGIITVLHELRGIYQHCGEQHLHRRLAEFDFRYTNRAANGVNDTDRAAKTAAAGWQAFA